ncbi:MAG: adenylyl-sulfate kinase, partial [Pseudomonadales bacterium]|nr:adenylyl-sulfate kinase [Pseudomonadales bacterium]
MARERVGEKDFLEIYVNTSLEDCEKRDVKGLYGKARRGEIPNMTGINSPYEPPEAPDFVADGGRESLETLVEKLLPVVLAAVEETGGED